MLNNISWLWLVVGLVLGMYAMPMIRRKARI